MVNGKTATPAAACLLLGACHLLYSDASRDATDVNPPNVTFRHQQRIVEAIKNQPTQVTVEPFTGNVVVSVAINDGSSLGPLAALEPSAAGEYKFFLPEGKRYAIRVHYESATEFDPLHDREIQGDSLNPQIVVDAVTRKDGKPLKNLTIQYAAQSPVPLSVVTLGVHAQTGLLESTTGGSFQFGDLAQAGRKRMLETDKGDEFMALRWTKNATDTRVDGAYDQVFTSTSDSPKQLDFRNKRNIDPITQAGISLPIDAARTATDTPYGLSVSHYPALAQAGPVFGITVFDQNPAQNVTMLDVPDVFPKFTRAWVLQTSRTQTFIGRNQNTYKVFDAVNYILPFRSPILAPEDVRRFPSGLLLNGTPLSLTASTAFESSESTLRLQFDAVSTFDHYLVEVIDATDGINADAPAVVCSYHATSPRFELHLSDFDPKKLYAIRVLARKGQDPDHTLDIFKRTLPFYTTQLWSGPFTVNAE